MLRQVSLSILAVGALAAISQAQEQNKYLTAVQSNNVTRVLAAGGAISQRYDYNRLRAYGTTAAAPGAHTINGTVTFLYVFTPAPYTDTWNTYIFPGLGAPTYAHGAPATASITVGALPYLGAGGHAVAFAPLALPVGGDYFVSVSMDQAGNNAVSPPTGIWSYFTLNTAANIYDIPGPRGSGVIAAADRLYTAWTAPAAPAALSTAFRHQWLEMLHDPVTSLGGVCVARTNQALQPGRGGDQTISGFLSGFHPDVNGVTTVTRFDDPGFSAEGALAAGVPFLFFLGNLGAINIPLTVVTPGSKGTLCLDPSLLLSMGVAVGNAAGAATLVVPLGPGPSPLRASLLGVNLNWWALGLAGADLIGTPCGQQRF